MNRDMEYENLMEEQFLQIAKNSHDGGKKPFISPVCRYCQHLYNTIARTCAAFPRGIPDPIWEGINNHRLPFPGDDGIQFQPHQLLEEEIIPSPQ